MASKPAGEFEIGVKAYDSDWFVKYGLSYSEAANLLKEWGCNFVLAQRFFIQGIGITGAEK